MWIMNFKPNRAFPSVMRSLSAIALIAFSATASGQAPAAWPTKPIPLVVTYPPRGGADAMARLWPAGPQPLDDLVGGDGHRHRHDRNPAQRREHQDCDDAEAEVAAEREHRR